MADGKGILNSGHEMKFSPIVSVGGRHIPKVSARLKFRDILGRWKARLGIGRMKFRVEPGIYAVGNAGRKSPIIVTANYKMTFDLVRQALFGRDAFILALDTKGINVWCAAGKGTFGTAELENRITLTDLKKVVDHRDLILPQLGAVGVSAHEIKSKTGFAVHYGPVDAADLDAYLSAGMEKTPDMTRVKFNLRDRLAIVPVEIVHAWWIVLTLFIACFLLSLPFDFAFNPRFQARFLTMFGAAVAGIVIFPPLLPWLPFRPFVAKGTVLGVFWSAAAVLIFGLALPVALPLTLSAVPVTAFLSMQYTGASTYTNLTGASQEVKLGVPAIVVSELLGVIGLIAERIVSALAV